MSLFVAALGVLGLGFGRLGAGQKHTAASPPATPTVGNPIGLLLTLTYAS